MIETVSVGVYTTVPVKYYIQLTKRPYGPNHYSNGVVGYSGGSGQELPTYVTVEEAQAELNRIFAQLAEAV